MKEVPGEATPGRLYQKQGISYGRAIRAADIQAGQRRGALGSGSSQRTWEGSDHPCQMDQARGQAVAFADLRACHILFLDPYGCERSAR